MSVGCRWRIQNIYCSRTLLEREGKGKGVGGGADVGARLADLHGSSQGMHGPMGPLFRNTVGGINFMVLCPYQALLD